MGFTSPGVSKNTSWSAPLVSTPIMRVRVVCGLRDTMAIFWPIIRLSREDLPTLGLPTIASSAERS